MAAHDAATSPTEGRQRANFTEQVGTEQKNAEDRHLEQVQQNEADAAYPRTLGKLTVNRMRRSPKLGPHQPTANIWNEVLE